MWRIAVNGTVILKVKFLIFRTYLDDGVRQQWSLQNWAVNYSLILRAIKWCQWIMTIFFFFFLSFTFVIMTATGKPLGLYQLHSWRAELSRVYRINTSQRFLLLKTSHQCSGLFSFYIPFSYGAWQDWHKCQDYAYSFKLRLTFFFSFPSPLAQKESLDPYSFSHLLVNFGEPFLI